jgi:hypothetical protein
MIEYINIRKGSFFIVLLVILAILLPKPTVSQSDTCQSCYMVVKPTPVMEVVLEKVCPSFNNCLCVRSGIPFYGRMWMHDTTLTVQLNQMWTILPKAPYVCIFDDIPFFIHPNDMSKFFKEINMMICADTLFDTPSWDGKVICSYSNVIDDDYYEAKYIFSGDSLHLCCEHPCITEQQKVPNLKPQNIHYSPKSLDKRCIYSPYVDTVSIAVVRLSVKFNNIRQMKVVDIHDMNYLWVYKYQIDRYPEKEYFYYDGCEIADSAQFAFYKSQIEDIVYKLHFYVPKKYKRFVKFKQKYGYDDYLITNFKINESESVVLTLKVLPITMQ